MRLPLFILSRFIKSNRNSHFISLLSIFTISGIALGVCVLIISLSVITGFEKAIKEKVIDFNSHIIISAFGQRNLIDSRKTENLILSTIGSELKDFQKFISKKAIYTYKDFADGIEVLAIEENHFNIKDLIVAGEKNYPKESQIVIGKKLAEKLNIHVGDKITLFVFDSEKTDYFDEQTSIKQFFVSGIFESDFAQYDDAKCFLNFEACKKLFGMEYLISGYNIKIKNMDKLAELAEKMQSKLNYPYFVRTIFQQYQNIFTWIELQKKPIPIILGLIAIVAVFNIIGTILMIILEKFSNIGLLISMGTKRSDIIKIFLFQGLTLSIAGIFLGNILALILIFLQVNFNIITLPGEIYFLSRVPLEIMPKIFVIVSAITLLFSLLASVIPSYIASKINIIKAVRFD